jgi:hypothetical protein
MIFRPVSACMMPLKSAKSSGIACEAPRITQSNAFTSVVAILKKGLL